MKRIFLPIFVITLAFSAMAQNDLQTRLKNHVYYMASDEMRGREAGSPEAAKTAQYLQDQYEDMGLEPFLDDFEWPFSSNLGKNFCNIVGVIEGSDPVLKKEYIVVGAHYDHIGMKADRVCNGADDNASGSAALVEVTRMLLAMDRSQIKRSIIIAAFDAEELGLFGSTDLAEKLQRLNSNVVLMLSLDMVGWYKASGSLTLEGVSTLDNADGWIRQMAKDCGIRVKIKDYENSLFTATDTRPFANKGVATLAVTTGLKSPYHKPEDDADLIDYEGMELVCKYLCRLVAKCAEGEVQKSGKVAPIHSDNVRKFDIGLGLGWSQSIVNYNESRLTTNSRSGMEISAALQWNWSKSWSLYLTPSFTYQPMYLVDPADALHSYIPYTQQYATVPISLKYSLSPMDLMDIHIFAGCYYSRKIHLVGAVAPSLPYYGYADFYHWGWHWGFGLKMGKFIIEDDFLMDIDPLFATVPAKMNRTVLRLSYYF